MQRALCSASALVLAACGREVPLRLLPTTMTMTVTTPACGGESVPPTQLACTGLYADFGEKTLAPGVRAYAPAVALWSDGAEKQRYIALPPGTKIKASDPNEWSFPVGTKVFKEFRRDGRRVETRMFEKVQAGFWVHAAYAWAADESEARISFGGDIPWGQGTYHIPSGDECDQCHRGRTDRVLGFEAVALGLAGAAGVTLADLAQEGLLSPPPDRTSLTIGDDGTGKAAAPLAWLHINCGTTCHNGNSDSMAYGGGLRLRLDPRTLDGRPASELDALKTTVGVAVHTPTWGGQLRIAAGDPKDSLVYKLISYRGDANQMPPIATRVVDDDDTGRVEAWIAGMPPAH